MKKLITALAIAGFAAAPVVLAQDTRFSDVDTDGDALLSIQELQVAVPSLTEADVAAYDMDADAMLSETEFLSWKAGMESGTPDDVTGEDDTMTPKTTDTPY